MSTSPLTVARDCLEAYVAKDRAAIEALIAKDYHFTSPIDNALDRENLFLPLLAQQQVDGRVRLCVPDEGR